MCCSTSHYSIRNTHSMSIVSFRTKCRSMTTTYPSVTTRMNPATSSCPRIASISYNLINRKSKPASLLVNPSALFMNPLIPLPGLRHALPIYSNVTLSLPKSTVPFRSYPLLPPLRHITLLEANGSLSLVRLFARCRFFTHLAPRMVAPTVYRLLGSAENLLQHGPTGVLHGVRAFQKSVLY